MSALRVLLIDDDARLFELLHSYFADHDVRLAHASDGPRGLQSLHTTTFDVVLLDVMMPGLDGLEVCKRIRQFSRVPVIMLTARGDETDRIVGLEIGADDYLPKPFSPRELLARMKAVMRRVDGSIQPPQDRLIVGDIALDAGSREVLLRGKRLDITGLEFDLLRTLMKRAGRVVARDTLLTEAGRSDVVVGERTIDVHISHLRQKLGDDSRSPSLIKTVRGVGYVLVHDEA